MLPSPPRFVPGVVMLLAVSLLCGCRGISSGGGGSSEGGQFQLSVTSSGPGTGTVTSTPAGINCPGTCSANFDSGTQVTLVATPGDTFAFSGWSGDCSGTGNCVLTLDSASSVTAAFGATLQAINHIIFMLQENRSFDHYFGAMRPYWAANGFPDQAFDGLAQFNDPPGPVPAIPGCDPTLS